MSACIGIEKFEQILASDKNKAKSQTNELKNKPKNIKIFRKKVYKD
jgi:hypothetical protein